MLVAGEEKALKRKPGSVGSVGIERFLRVSDAGGTPGAQRA
jgi:hypothetical protein